MSRNPKSPAKQNKTEPKPPVSDTALPQPPLRQPEFGGRKGLEETRFGDWEINGKCVDF